MPTVLDALVVTLGLDSSGYAAGSAVAVQSIKKTSSEATTAAKEMQSRGAQAAEFFTKIRNEALGLLTVLVGGKGLEAFTKDAVTSLSSLGRAAHDIGIGVPQLAALRNMIQAAGGDADAAQASFQNLAQALERAKIYRPSNELQTFLGSIGASPSDKVDAVYARFNQWAQGKDPERVITLGQQGGLDIGSIREAMKPVAQFQKDYAEGLLHAPTGQQVKNMQELQHAWINVEQAATQAGNALESFVAPGLTKILTAVEHFIDAHPTIAGGVEAGAAVAVPAGGAALAWWTLKKLFGATPKAAAAAGEGAAAEGAAVAGAAATGGFWSAVGGVLARALGPVGVFAAVLNGGGLNNGEDARLRAERAGNAHPIGPPLSARSKQAYDYFASQGWSKDQAAALAGDIQGESGFDETTLGDNKTAVGIAQWHPDRVQKILAGTGIDVRTAGWPDQLKAMQWDLTHGEYKVAGDKLRATSGVFNAESSVVSDYERSKWQSLDISKRSWYAEHYALQFANLPPGVPIPSPGQGATSARPSTSSQLHVGQITIHTQATDAAGISKDIGKSLKDYGFVAQANLGIY